MASNLCSCFFIVAVLSILFATRTTSQPQTSDACNGIFVSYAYTGGTRLPPNISDAVEQPYRFESTLTVLNNGLVELKSWKVVLLEI
jgi:hypothetical protein